MQRTSSWMGICKMISRNNHINNIININYMSDITVILNFYNKTVNMLNKQMKTLENQSIRPKYIWGCFLGCKDNLLLNAFLKWKDKFDNLDYISSSYNFKYIGRYQLALTAPTEYIIVLDDDRFPNKNFIKRTRDILIEKNCIIGQYGWILDDIKMDINGLFVFPNWMGGLNYKGIGYKYNKLNLYSSNIVNEWNKPSHCTKEYAKSRMKYETPCKSFKENTLLHVDYLCGGMSFRKSTLSALFDSVIETTYTGEDIMFCLKAKKKGIPIYCLSPEYNEFVLADDGDISSTSNLIILKKRTNLIRQILS